MFGCYKRYEGGRRSAHRRGFRSRSMVVDKTASTHGRQGDIDSLRCFAMAAVVAQHSHILPFGWMGVWIFYVISGFVVTSALRSRPLGPPRQWLTDFYIRRTARIAPVYYAYLAVGFVVMAAMGRYQWETFALLGVFVGNIAEMIGLGELNGWATGHLWTVSVEMQFYLVYGLAYLFLPRRRLVQVLIGFLVLAPLFRALEGAILPSFKSPAGVAYAIYASPIAHFDAFAAGALLALRQARMTARNGQAKLFALGVAMFVAYCLVYVAVNIIVRHQHGPQALRCIISGILYGEGREIWLYSALMVLNAGVVAWSATGQAPWRRITQFPLFRHVGEISYSAYIFHGMTLTWTGMALSNLLEPKLTNSILGHVLLFAGGLVGAVILAEISFRLFETPIIRRTNLWLKARMTRPPASPEPAAVL
jgi:peptidoglycan/LPS O-acetylase OafA/YrhL